MSIRGGPDIIEDGLVLHLDAAEPLCFRGEPTTNLISDPFMVNGSPSPIIMAYEGTGTVTADLPDSSMHSVSNKWMKVVKNSSTNGRMLFLGLTGLTVGVDYCFSAYIYTNDTNLTAINPTSDNVSVSPIYSAVGYNLSNRGTIQRIHCIFRTTSGGQFIGIRVGSTNPIGSTFYFTGIQVEQKSYPTRVVNGTRGSTVATGGGLLDLTNNGNNGTITRAASPSAGFYNASNGGSFVFDGSSDYISCGNNSIFDITQQITLMCWINKTDKTGYHHFLSKFPVSNCSYSLYSKPSSGYLSFQFSTNGTNQDPNNISTFSQDVCTGEWTFVCASYNSLTSTVLMAINDNFYSETETGSIYASTSNLEIARRSGVGQYWPGKISNVSIYNRALSADEIRQNYNATKGRFGL